MKLTTTVNVSRTDVRDLAKIAELIQRLLAKLPAEFTQGRGLRLDSERAREVVNRRWEKARGLKAAAEGAKEVA